MRWPSRPWLLGLLLAVGTVGGSALQTYMPSRRAVAPAQAVVRAFMLCRLSRDETCVRSYLSRQLHTEYVASGEPDLVGGVDPHYDSYRIISQAKQPDGSWEFVVRINEEIAGHGASGWFTETILVSPVAETYLIAKVEKGDLHNLP